MSRLKFARRHRVIICKVDRKLLFALLASAALGVVLWNNPALYPFKLLVVLMHESSHAAAALLMGGRVLSIQVSPDEGGLTTSMLPQSMLRHVVVSSAGYVGSTISGCVLLAIAARSKQAKWPLIVLAGWTGAVALLWVRDGFTLLFTGGTTLARLVVARFAPQLARRALLVFLATFSALYALFDIRDDLLHFTSRGVTDAVMLSQQTHVPALVWGIGWGALSLAVLIVTLRTILRAPSASGAASRPA